MLFAAFRRTFFRSFLAAGAVSCLMTGFAEAPDRQAPPPYPAVTPAVAPKLDTGFGKLPLQFIPNKGQIEAAVAYYVEGRDKTIFFTAEGLTFSLANDRGPEEASSARRWVIKLDFVGAKNGVVPVGLEKSGAIVSFFKGDPKAWKAGLAACSKVVYRDLWPGIDLIYSGTFNRMKYEFVVRPGADPSRIALAYRGTEEVRLASDGRLVIRTPAGGFEDDAPIAYQDIDGTRRGIPVAYDLEASMYGFAVGAYDRSRTLVIDPSSLVYCGFIGGQAADTGAGIAVDGEGSVYVVGTTASSEINFPVTAGPDLSFNSGSEDAFIAKISPDGTELVYCGYIGGSATDRGLNVAVDAAGCAYIVGSTDSAGSTFPVTIGPDLTSNGNPDAFVAKVDPSGTALLYCGYIGGDSNDMGKAIAVDDLGNAYVSGVTASDEETFPVKAGPDLTKNGFGPDAFVAKVDSSGAELAYCGYIGGHGVDSSQGIAVDGFGQAYVSGYTSSSESDGFPATGVPDREFTGLFDAFVAKVSASGAALDFCGYYGIGTWTYDSDIAVDGSGNIYIVGYYFLDSQTEADAFIVKYTSSGAYVYSRSIGGMDDDRASGVAVDAWENVYIAGTTNSNTNTFPETVGPGLVRKYHGDTHDSFVAKLGPSGSGPFDYCGFIGGFSEDKASGIAVDGSGNAYVVGTTADGDWAHFPVIGGPGLDYNGGDSDAFVAKVPPIPAVSNPMLTAVRPPSALAGEIPLTVTLEGSDFVYGAFAYWRGSPRPTRFISDSELTSDSIPPDLWEGANIDIHVCNPDGQTVGPVRLTINSPVPVLDSLSPASAIAGSSLPGFRLLGSNFLRSSIIRWNGAALSAGWDGYVSSGALDAGIPLADLAAGGEFQVAVENPAPAGGTTASLVFRIATVSLSASTASLTVNAGQQAVFPLLLTPMYGSFDAPVALSCEGLPEHSTASFSPATPTPGSTPLNIVLTVTTKAPSMSAAAGALGPAGSLPPALGLLLLIAAALLARSRPLASPRHSKTGRWVTAGVLAFVMLITASCGTGGDGSQDPHGPRTPAGTYQITVRADSGSLSVAMPVTLIVR